MEPNRLKAKEELLYYTQEIVQALNEADIVRMSIAREKLLENADIVFREEIDKLNVYRVVAASYMGAYNQGEALSLVKKIVKICRKVYPKNSPEQIEAYDMLAHTCYAAEKYEDARKLSGELVRYYEKKRGMEDRKTLKALFSVGMCDWKLGDYEAAIAKIERSYRYANEFLGATHIDTLTYRREMALCYFYVGKYKKAFLHIAKTYEVCLLEYGEEHSLTLTAFQSYMTIGKGLTEEEKAMILQR